jgi:hypothetical protein
MNLKSNKKPKNTEKEKFKKILNLSAPNLKENKLKINHKKFAFCLTFALFCQTKLFNVLIKKLNKNLKLCQQLNLMNH